MQVLAIDRITNQKVTLFESLPINGRKCHTAYCGDELKVYPVERLRIVEIRFNHETEN